MYRRQLLSTLVATSVGGCIGTTSQKQSEPSDESEITLPILSVENDETPSSLKARLRATILNHWTLESPARIRISFTNQQLFPRLMEFGATPPFTSLVGSHETSDARLLLVPHRTKRVGPSDASVDNIIPDLPNNRCWRANSNLVVQSIAKSRLLFPTQSISRQYTVLAHPKNSNCFPPGSYRFEDRYRIDDKSVRWGFTLTVQQK